MVGDQRHRRLRLVPVVERPLERARQRDVAVPVDVVEHRHVALELARVASRRSFPFDAEQQMIHQFVLTTWPLRAGACLRASSAMSDSAYAAACNCGAWFGA